MAAEQVLAAIQALFHSSEPHVKADADRFLERWQQTPEAWSLSDSLLHNPGTTMEAQHFCAQTLKTKVQRDFDELPAEAVPQLRASLFDLLLKFARGAPPVRTQLCLALAALAVHVPAQQWADAGAAGAGCVRWFAGRLSAQPADVALPCLLELLTVLPQEADGRASRVAARPERRREFVRELTAAVGDALEVLSSCLSQPGERVRSQVLEAFGPWLRLTGGHGLPVALISHPLVSAALEGLKTEATFHAAVDAVCELIWVTVDPDESNPNMEMQPLAQAIVQMVMAMRPRLAVAARRLEAEAQGRDLDDGVADEFDDDADTAKQMARVMCEAAEAYIRIIAAAATPDVVAPVDAMLEIAAYPDPEIRCMCYYFWHKLSRQLCSGPKLDMDSDEPEGAGAGPTSMAGQGGDSGGAAAAADHERRVAFFKPALEKLVVTLSAGLGFPQGFASWASTERSDWRRARHDAADVVLDAAYVLGPGPTLGALTAPLRDVSAAVAARGPDAFDWRSVELALFCIRGVRRLGFVPGEPALEMVLASLPGLPRQPDLQYTAAMLIAGYSDWLARSVASGHCQGLLPRLVQALTAALTLPEAALAAASALRSLCEACGQFMRDSVEQLVGLYQRVLRLGGAASALAGSANGATAGDDLLLVGLSEDEVQAVMEGVLVCACRCIPAEQLAQGLGALVDPVLQPLGAAVQPLQQQPQSTGAAGSSGRMQLSRVRLALIDRVSTLFRSIPDSAVVSSILQRAWPALDAALTLLGNDESGLERVSRAVRYGIKASGRLCAPLLPVLLQSLPARFQQTRHPAFMYVVSELVKIFASEPAASATLAPVLGSLLGTACSGLTSLAALAASPDLVDDAFLLAGRALHYMPAAVVTPSLLPLLANTALLGVLLQHREACTSCITFFCRLLEAATSRQVSQQQQLLLQEEALRTGPPLTRLLLGGAAGGLPDARVPDVAELLAVLLRTGQGQALAWLAAALGVVPDTAAGPGDREALAGAAAAYVAAAAGGGGGAAVANQEEVWVRSLDDFVDLCRRNRRTMLAATRALLPPELHSAVGVA